MLRASLKGVIETKTPDLSVEKMKEIYTKENLLKEKIKRKNVGIISDGTAVLGLGNIGAYAAMPVMEGKAAIFKALGEVNAFPICIKTQDIDEIIDISVALSKSFGGVNLEDINAPRCFEIEEKLSEKTDIPIRIVNDLTFKLVEASMIIEISSDEKGEQSRYIPAENLSNLSVGTLVDRIEAQGKWKIDLPVGELLSADWKRVLELRGNYLKSLKDVKLESLA